MLKITCEKPSSISLPLVSKAVMACNFSVKSRTGCTRIEQMNNSSWWRVIGSNTSGYGKLVHYLSASNMTLYGMMLLYVRVLSSKKGKEILPTSNFIYITSPYEIKNVFNLFFYWLGTQ